MSDDAARPLIAPTSPQKEGEESTQPVQQVAIPSRDRSDTLIRVLATEINPRAPKRKDVTSPLYYLYAAFKSFPMQSLMIVLTFVDISFLLYEFISGDVSLAVVTLVTSLMFFLEIVVNWSYEGTAAYFQKDRLLWIIAEVIIVTLSFVVEYTEYVLEAVIPTTNLQSDLRYLRAIRFFRALIIWKTRYRNFTAALRRLVSADRRRYQQDGYDLDLTYVHAKIIAMSWPSSQAESIYRNNIDTVAAFLDDKHKDHYRVYNLCSERAYDESKFHNQCVRYRIDDHSPPELLVMKTFAEDVHSFIQANPRLNVAVIHCKGGKGRTGTMVCTYLIYSGIKKSADDALSHFGVIRTSDDAKNFQGVESPSQDRYIRYFERLLRLPGQVPPKRCVQFTTVILHDVPFSWWSNGIDRLWFAMISAPSTKRHVVYLSNRTVTFDAQIPENPFQKRKVALGQQVRKPSSSPGGALSPRDADVQQANVYSDEEGATGYTSPAFTNTADTPSSPVMINSDPCQPFSSNMTLYVNRDLDHPMDYATFSSLHLNGSTTASTTSEASRTLLSVPQSQRFVGGKAAQNLNRSLRVSVGFDVSDMPPFEGDMNLRFFFNQDDPNTLQCTLQTFFHPAFEGSGMRLTKTQLDGPHKEATKEKKFPMNIELELAWKDVGDSHVNIAPENGGTLPVQEPHN